MDCPVVFLMIADDSELIQNKKAKYVNIFKYIGNINLVKILTRVFQKVLDGHQFL